MLKLLTHFAVLQTAAGYILQVETEDGDVIELLATNEQLDLISNQIGQRSDLHMTGVDEAGPDDAAEKAGEAVIRTARPTTPHRPRAKLQHCA